MRPIAVGILLLAIFATPVFAQGNRARPDTPEEIQKKKDAEVVDQQYKSTLKRMKQDDAAPSRADPWANMRGSSPTDGKR